MTIIQVLLHVQLGQFSRISLFLIYLDLLITYNSKINIYLGN